jgi:hypothetical protein
VSYAQEKILLDFLDESGLFTEQKRFFTKKKIVGLLTVKQFRQPSGEFFFQPRDSFFSA